MTMAALLCCWMLLSPDTAVADETLTPKHAGTARVDKSGNRAAAGLDQPNLLAGGEAGFDLRAVVEFDVSAISGPVKSAQLKLFVSSSTAAEDLYLRRISADGSITEDDYDSDPLDEGGILISSGAEGLQTFDITKMLNTALADKKPFFAVRVERASAAFGEDSERANIKGMEDANQPLIEYSPAK